MGSGVFIGFSQIDVRHCSSLFATVREQFGEHLGSKSCSIVPARFGAHAEKFLTLSGKVL
jgi:hypothetical protein